jgi:hypothetical protein
MTNPYWWVRFNPQEPYYYSYQPSDFHPTSKHKTKSKSSINSVWKTTRSSGWLERYHFQKLLRLFLTQYRRHKKYQLLERSVQNRNIFRFFFMPLCITSRNLNETICRYLIWTQKARHVSNESNPFDKRSC